MTQKTMLWLLWCGLSIGFAAFLGLSLLDEKADKSVFLPGPTTSGHHQIELACGACHTSDFADPVAIQNACEGCHLDALKEAKDAHPKSKFTDPRNADRIAVLDARNCTTCHVEHRTEITATMGVTIPADFCYLCHKDVATDRPSHAGMVFDSCASAGCHNYHDNRALYEDFLVKHGDAPAITPGQLLTGSNFGEIAEHLEHYPQNAYPVTAVHVADAPTMVTTKPAFAPIHEEWLDSSHARAGVNCTACHEANETGWSDSPDHNSCKSCHVDEVEGFLLGKHGMRLNQAKLSSRLTPMSPHLARLPMKAESKDRQLTCQTCHGAHAFNSRNAVVKGCLGCHEDQHSLAYIDSKHYQLWQREQAGELPEGSGVTCASCHMPRLAKDYMWGAFVHNLVEHNQSATLQPNEKMIRPVCLQCHGLGFSIDALADKDLINNNFNGAPGEHIESIGYGKKTLVGARDRPRVD